MLKGSVWEEPKDWADLSAATCSLEKNVSRVRFEGFDGEWHYEGDYMWS